MNSKKKLFKIRCSAIGNIMTNPVGPTPMDKYLKCKESLEKHENDYKNMANKDTKTAQNKLERIMKLNDELKELEKTKDEIVLSKTCIAYLEDWIKENYYWRKKQLHTNPIKKGIECENESIFVINKALWTKYVKSRYAEWEQMENDWCVWHEDIDDKDNKKTIDAKVSYSFDSFPIVKDELENNYYWQWQWYMWLKWEDYKKHEVIKVLVNTPAWQLRSLLYNTYNNVIKQYEETPEYIDEEYEKIAKQIFLWHVFDKQLTINSDWAILELTDDEVIPYDKRIHIFEIDRNDEDIEKIKKRVEECRIWLEQNWY